MIELDKIHKAIGNTGRVSIEALSNENISSFLSTLKTLRTVSCHMPELKSEVEKRTSFLDDVYGKLVTITLRCNALKENIVDASSIPRCQVCEEKVSVSKKYGIFNKTCSKKCSIVLGSETTRQSLMEVHGVSSYMHLDFVKKKYQETMLERYGVKHARQAGDFPIESLTKEAIQELYDEMNGNVALMAKEVGVAVATMRRHVKNAGIDTRYGISAEALEVLNNYDEMFALYQKMGVPEAAKTISVSEGTFYRYLKKHGIETCGLRGERKKEVRIDGSVFRAIDALGDRDILLRVYSDGGVEAIMATFDLSETQAYEYLERNGIDRIRTKESHRENQLTKFIASLGFKAKENYRGIFDVKQKEIDIFIPEKNIGFEFNGLYWHSDRFKKNSYHLDKTKEAYEKGITLIHVFEDEWVHRKEQVKSKIKSILGVDDREVVYARKCKIVKLSNREVRGFYDTTHIQGHVNAGLIIGLEYEGETVAAMSFKRTRGYLELVRYATSARVVGGFSKLMNYFWKNTDEENLVSFADIRWSSGNLYEKNGWTLVGKTPPNYYYVKGDDRLLKQKFRKSSIKKNYPDIYCDKKTEREMMEEVGMPRIYDCGLLKYEITNPMEEKKEHKK